MLKMKYGKKLVLFTLFAMNLVDQPAPEVKVEQGILSGKISGDGTFFEYVGIPYATTSSATRFQAPLPPPSWKGVFKAVDEISSCPQSTPLGVMGQENCLIANVYVPAMAKRPLPVMVYIHGGAFILGNGGKSLYAPDFIVQKEVILVTFNYRLGALGFMCLGIKEAPGNAGLKDQIAALRWVKKNIAAFGGDPDNVTIFGESAGATSASILLASEATEGLFNRVIVQSGSSLANWAINREPIWTASLIAKTLGYDTKDPYELYKIFAKLSFKELVTAKPVKPLDLFFDTQLLHLPCVEEPIEGEEAVLNDLPYNLLINKPKNVSVIYGSTSKEGLFLIAEDTEETIEKKNNQYLFASDLGFNSEDEAASVAKRVKEFYFGKERISIKKILNVSDVYTHLYFEMPAILEIDILLRNTNASIYNYIFNYSGGRNFLKSRTGFGNVTGACHGDDILYLFKGYLHPYRISEEDQKIIDWMTTMWTNFAKYGNPTPTPTKDLPVRWEPSTKENLKFLYIDNELKIGPMPNKEAYDLWKDIYSRYRKKSL